jgi:hypothetical protein
MTEAPDMTLYLVIHRGMRTDAARLARAVARVEEGERTQRAATIAKWWTGYHSELHSHHTIEDEYFFSALVEVAPQFAKHLDRINPDHEHLTELMTRTTAALTGLGDPQAPWERAQREAVNATGELSGLITEHLDFEDEEVVPMFLEHMGAQQYEEISQKAMKDDFKLKQAMWTIPWALATADDAETKVMLDEAPFAFKLLWFASRRRYRKLEMAALGPADAGTPSAN